MGPLQRLLHPYRRCWQLFRQRGENPLILHSNIQVPGGALRWGLRALLYGLWVAAVVFVCLLPRVIPATTGFPPSGAFLICAYLFAPGAMVIYCSLRIAYTVSRMLEPGRLEDLYLTRMTPGEVVFGVFWPPFLSCLAVSAPVLAGIGILSRQTALHLHKDLQMDDGYGFLVAGMIVLWIGLVCVVLWTFLLTVRFVLAFQFHRWKAFIATFLALEVLARTTAIFILWTVIGVADAAALGIGKQPPSWIIHLPVVLVLPAVLIVTDLLLRLATTHAGERFYCRIVPPPDPPASWFADEESWWSPSVWLPSLKKALLPLDTLGMQTISILSGFVAVVPVVRVQGWIKHTWPASWSGTEFLTVGYLAGAAVAGQSSILVRRAREAGGLPARGRMFPDLVVASCVPVAPFALVAAYIQGTAGSTGDYLVAAATMGGVLAALTAFLATFSLAGNWWRWWFLVLCGAGAIATQAWSPGSRWFDMMMFASCCCFVLAMVLWFPFRLQAVYDHQNRNRGRGRAGSGGSNTDDGSDGISR